MKSLRTVILATVTLFFAFAASAQEVYKVEFRGTCRTTNEFGEIVEKTITHQNLIRECAKDLGITNANRLRLVYHVNGDLNGDTIEVRNQNGTIRCTKFLLLFTASEVANGDASESTKLVEVFGEQQSEMIGTAVIDTRVNSSGNTRIDGTMNFFRFPEGDKGTRIYTATFHTGPLLSVDE